MTQTAMETVEQSTVSALNVQVLGSLTRI